MGLKELIGATPPPELHLNAGERMNIVALSSRGDVLLLSKSNVLRYGHIRRSDEGMRSLRFGGDGRGDGGHFNGGGGVAEMLSPGEKLTTVSFAPSGDAALVLGPDWAGVVHLPARGNDGGVSCKGQRDGEHAGFGLVQLAGLGARGGSGRLLQASWHPQATAYVVGLTAGRQLLVWDTASGDAGAGASAGARCRPLLPEQQLDLSLGGGRSAAGGDAPVAFAFGAAHGWERFSVFLLFAAGEVRRGECFTSEHSYQMVLYLCTYPTHPIPPHPNIARCLLPLPALRRDRCARSAL